MNENEAIEPEDPELNWQEYEKQKQSILRDCQGQSSYDAALAAYIEQEKL